MLWGGAGVLLRPKALWLTGCSAKALPIILARSFVMSLQAPFVICFQAHDIRDYGEREFLFDGAKKKNRDPFRNHRNTRPTANKEKWNRYPELVQKKKRCCPPFTNTHKLIAVTNILLKEFLAIVTLYDLTPGHWDHS